MDKMEAMEKEQKQQEAQKKLFEGLKFFLNREAPRESLAFVIRWVRAVVVKLPRKSQDVFTERNKETIRINLKLVSMFCVLLLPYRCFGGEVSWDKSVCIGSTYEVTDETITHQIVDRPNIDKQYINR